MNFAKILCIATLFFNCLYGFGQSKGEIDYKLKLMELSEFKEHRSPISSLEPVNIWGTDTSIDSILWSIPLKKNTHDIANKDDKESSLTSSGRKQISCGELPSQLLVLQTNLADSVRISLSKRHNPFLNEKIEYVYATDSLRSWTVENVPDGQIPKTSVNFPFCVDGKMVIEPVELYLIPLKNPVVSWNDDRLNHIPTLSTTLATDKIADFLGAEVYVIKPKYSNFYSLYSIEVKENGNFHRNKIDQGIIYKHSYQLHDKFNINQKTYQIDSIDWEADTLYLHSVAETTTLTYIPTVHMEKILPYFSQEKDYLLLDFWGTWCAPCIQTLPHLKELYDSKKEKYDFLSFCFDQSSNFDNAKLIFSEHGITWPQLMDDWSAIGGTISRDLGVSNFPTYMVIDRQGEVIYSNFGSEGFEGLMTFMLQ